MGMIHTDAWFMGALHHGIHVMHDVVAALSQKWTREPHVSANHAHDSGIHESDP